MKKKLLIGFAILVALLFWGLLSIYPDWLWFGNLGFASIFWTILLSKLGFGLIVWVLLIIIVTLNLFVAQRLNPGGPGIGVDQEGGYFSQIGLTGKTFNIVLFACVMIISFVIATKGSDQWDMALRYLNQQPFGATDPIFGKDIGYYMFSLPLYVFIRDGFLILFGFAALVTISWYLKNGALQVVGDLSPMEGSTPSLPKITIAPQAMKHLLFLIGVVALIMAWGYHFKVYGLLYSTQGPAYGASYTDVHVKLLAYRVMVFASLALAVVLFMNCRRPRTKVLLVSGAAWLGIFLVLVTAAPLLVQQFIVKPNELAKEEPYIAHNIAATREAFALNKIQPVAFAVGDRLNAADLERNEVTIQNIRIWDERPLLQTYRQIQAIRLYYNFNNVDVDRYTLAGRYRQLMLAAREFVVTQLPREAKTWVNSRLIYTHGYGLAASPVNEVTSEGLPNLLIKDLPPSFEPGLEVSRPEIYYGEKTEGYVLVNTKIKEFDYPKGDKNVYSMYEGKGGVQIDSFVRRLLFAIEFLDPQILFTGYLKPESRIMYIRRIDRRVRAIAPFLDYDRDPYLVLSEGRLTWIQDAYTASNMYPYSRPSRSPILKKNLNYIRNPVKVTIDAYSGAVSFYIIDETDPIVRTYAKIFPDLFKPFAEMPEDLKRHIRYPRDLFKIQVGAYRTYHMEDVRVFYNQEDLWQIPDELYGDSRQEMEPYYIIIKLPEGEKEEFLIMLPFTPSDKDNMIGWLAARCDLPHYGNLLVYKLPKEKLVYGPMQIEARVDQQTEISRELSLWSQRGSRVIRGNLLAIPVADTFIYVEPVYLEAKQEQQEPRADQQSQQSQRRRPLSSQGPDRSRAAALPELKRVIASFANRIVWAENLETALYSVLGEGIVSQPVEAEVRAPASDIGGLGRSALEHYQQAQEFLRAGNWAGYGNEMRMLEDVLVEMSRPREEGEPH